MFARRAGLSFLFLAACAAAASADVVLQRKFADGTKYKSREAVTVKQSLVLGGMNLDTDSTTTVTTQINYGERNSDGELAITTKVESIKSDLKLPGGVSVKFDSANPDTKSDNPIAAAVFDAMRKMLGAAITFHLDGKNRVQSVEGVPEGGLQSGPEEVKEEFQRGIDLLPEKPLKPGETWEQTVKQNLGQGQVLPSSVRSSTWGTWPNSRPSKTANNSTKSPPPTRASRIRPGRPAP